MENIVHLNMDLNKDFLVSRFYKKILDNTAYTLLQRKINGKDSKEEEAHGKLFTIINMLLSILNTSCKLMSFAEIELLNIAQNSLLKLLR